METGRNYSTLVGFNLLQLDGPNKFLLEEQTPVKALQENTTISNIN